MTDTDARIYRRSDLTPEISLLGTIPQPEAETLAAALAQLYADAIAELDDVSAYLDQITDWVNDENYRGTVAGIEQMALDTFDPESPWNKEREALGETHYENTIAARNIVEKVADYYGIAASATCIFQLTTTQYDYLIQPTDDEIATRALEEGISYTEAETEILTERRCVNDVATYNTIMTAIPQNAKMAVLAQVNNGMLLDATKEGTASLALANATAVVSSKTQIISKTIDQDNASFVKATQYGLGQNKTTVTTSAGAIEVVQNERHQIPLTEPYQVQLLNRNLNKNSVRVLTVDSNTVLTAGQDFTVNLEQGLLTFLSREKTIYSEDHTVPSSVPYVIQLANTNLTILSSIYRVDLSIALTEGRDFIVDKPTGVVTIINPDLVGRLLTITYTYQTNYFGKAIDVSYSYTKQITQVTPAHEIKPAEMMYNVAKQLNKGASLLRQGANVLNKLNGAKNALLSSFSPKLQASVDLSALTAPLCSILDTLKQISQALSTIVSAFSSILSGLNAIKNALKGLLSFDALAFPGINFGINFNAGCLGKSSYSPSFL